MVSSRSTIVQTTRGAHEGSPLVGTTFRLVGGKVEAGSAFWTMLDVVLPPQDPDYAAWMVRVEEADRFRLEAEIETCRCGLGGLFELEYRVRDSRGALRWLRVKGVGMGQSGDGTDIVEGWQEDVTPRREREEALRQAEERFRLLIDHCPDALLVERQGRVVFANQRLLQLLGATVRQVVENTPLLQWVPLEDRSRLLSLLAHPADTPPPVELRLLLCDAGSVPVELTGARLTLDGLPALFVVARDVTERRRMEVDRLQIEKMSSLGMLAAGVAHEINNPLTAVVANLELIAHQVPRLVLDGQRLARAIDERLAPEIASALRDEAGSLLDRDFLAELSAALSDARDSATRVQAIVSDLKQFTRHEVREGAVDLASVIDRALRLSHHALKHNANVRREIGTAPPVRGEQGRLCQVLINLLVNASQAFTAPAEGNLITVRLVAEAEWVRVEVEDNGAGIPPEVLPRIFDPFFTTKGVGEGSGIGLSLSRHIVEGFGGQIEARSAPARGTTLVLRLPAVHLEQAVPAPKPSLSPSPRTRRPPRGRVLIIDDETILCRSLERFLSTEWAVVTLSCGEDAIALLTHDAAFQVVLCDLMMPDLSGLAIHEWVQRHRPELTDRMVFMTGGVTQFRVRAQLDRLPNKVLEKPLDLEHLARTLAGFAEGAPERPSERRAAVRLPGNGLRGRLPTAGTTLAVVDFSRSGVRLAGKQGPPPPIGEVVVLELEKGSEPERRVSAQARLVRTATAPNRVDLCFQFVELDAASRSLYEDWLGHGG